MEKLRISFWVFVLSTIILFGGLIGLLLGYLGVAHYFAALLFAGVLYGGYYVSPYVIGILLVDLIFSRKKIEVKSFILALILNVIFFFVAKYGFQHMYGSFNMMG